MSEKDLEIFLNSLKFNNPKTNNMTLHPDVTHKNATNKYATLAKRLADVHGDKYNYSKAVYRGASITFEVICSKHEEHPNFWMRPSDLLSGQNCPECSRLSGSASSRKSQEKVIAQFIKAHGDRYDYSKVEYINTDTPVIIGCPIHGDVTTIPKLHIKGTHCRKCGNDNAGKTQTRTTEQFIKEASIKHNNFYDYSESLYVEAHTKLVIICPRHGPFSNATANSHLRGTGCPSCATSGFDVDKPAIVYYLKIIVGEEILYKVGITNRTVKERFSNTDLDKIIVVNIKHFENGQDAYDLEQRILKKHKEFRYRGTDVLASGNTELFTKDVLGFDKKEP